MKERPILFTGPMVRALLDGRKTQTRRLVKPRDAEELGLYLKPEPSEMARYFPDRSSAYGRIGDRLWVKETFSAHGALGVDGRIYYRASIEGEKEPHGLHWKPSIFMPRKASRITLEITAVRVERLNAIPSWEAVAEGIEQHEGVQPDNVVRWKNYQFQTAHPRKAVVVEDRLHRILAFKDPVESYASLWQKINGDGSWALNPWVWVIEFRRVQS